MGLKEMPSQGGETQKSQWLTQPFPFTILFYEFVSALSVAGHVPIAMDKKFDVGLAELWVIAREGYGFVAVFTL